MSIEGDVLELTNDCELLLPEDELEKVRVLAGAGEWRVALENLITQLYEYDTSLSAALGVRFAALANATGLGKNYFELLNKLAKH